MSARRWPPWASALQAFASLIAQHKRRGRWADCPSAPRRFFWYIVSPPQDAGQSQFQHALGQRIHRVATMRRNHCTDNVAARKHAAQQLGVLADHASGGGLSSAFCQAS